MNSAKAKGDVDTTLQRESPTQAMVLQALALLPSRPVALSFGIAYRSHTLSLLEASHAKAGTEAR